MYIVDEDSAAYDACIVVENPSNKREVRSTYDNIPEIPEENTYKALDPTTREPAGQYQSLVKPENEVSYDCCCTVHFIMIYINILSHTIITLIVREAEVQKYMFTYHIEGQFHFALKLSVTCLI